MTDYVYLQVFVSTLNRMEHWKSDNLPSLFRLINSNLTYWHNMDKTAKLSSNNTSKARKIMDANSRHLLNRFTTCTICAWTIGPSKHTPSSFCSGRKSECELFQLTRVVEPMFGVTQCWAFITKMRFIADV